MVENSHRRYQTARLAYSSMGLHPKGCRGFAQVSVQFGVSACWVNPVFFIMKTILEYKVLLAIGLLAIAGGIWWFSGYSKDKSLCEDAVRFYGKTSDGYYCVASYSFGQCEQGARRFESRELAMDACMKSKRK